MQIRMSRSLASCLLVATVALSTSAFADSPKRKGERAELRERVRGKMAEFLTRELSSRVGLDAAKTEQLGAAVRAQMQRRSTQHREMKEEMKKLRTLVDDKAAEGAVRAQLDKVLALAERDERMKGFIDDTRAFLTPLEQARLALAFPEVMRESRKQMREARGERAGGKFREDSDD